MSEKYQNRSLRPEQRKVGNIGQTGDVPNIDASRVDAVSADGPKQVAPDTDGTDGVAPDHSDLHGVSSEQGVTEAEHLSKKPEPPAIRIIVEGGKSVP